jgi:hypothetical protein
VDNLKGVDNVNDVSIYEQTSLIPEGEITTTYKKKRKRKVITIDLNHSLVEGNFMDTPMALMDRKNDDIGTIELKWVDSNGVSRSLKMIASNESNLPSGKDFNVLMGLMKIYSEQNPEIMYREKENRYDMPIRINFTYAELARTMGYSSIGGSTIKQLQQSIRNLAQTTIISEGGLYDPISRSYIDDRERSYRIIEYDIYKYSDLAEGEKRLNARAIKEANYVEISSFFYNSMCSGNFKIINYSLYKDLKRDISKQVYLILDKWRGIKAKKPFAYYKYDTLYSRIALSDKLTIPVKNRYIRRAADDLKEAGYIKDYIMKPGEGICFVFDDSIAIDLDRMNDSYLGLDNYNDWDDVVDALIAYGVPDNIIEQYVNKSNLEYVKALLRSFDVAIRYDRIEKNATGFLIKGLKTAYNIPKKYYTSSMESLNTRHSSHFKITWGLESFSELHKTGISTIFPVLELARINTSHLTIKNIIKHLDKTK